MRSSRAYPYRTAELHRIRRLRRRAIVKSIEEREDVATTVVHLSEMLNVIEAGLGLQRSLRFLAWTLTCGNLKLYPVAAEDYESALIIAEQNGVGVDDALAYLCMKRNGIGEVYSFDKRFNQLKDVIRLPKLK